MQSGTRIAINTIVQYIRTIVNVCLGLYSTRLILHALGSEDYGIYMLVAGIVGMLSFLTNALSITTQRFLSYEQGAQNMERQRLIFANSLFIHVALGFAVFLILEVVGLFLFDGALSISPYRYASAKVIYHIALIMVMVSILTSPFRACLVAHENLVFSSMVDIADGIWKVVIAIVLTYANTDRLIMYSVLMLGVYVFSFLCFMIYACLHYNESKGLRIRHINCRIFKDLASFAGWSLYSSGCIIGRNQGTAIVLNRFFGTVINASYGIAVQVSGAISFVASSLLTAFNPPISKAAGQNNEKRMLMLGQTASKLSLMLMCMFGIPLLSRLHDILQLWLDEVPQDAALLCSVIMVAAMFDQLTSGLISVNRAIGKLKLYSLIVDTIKILCVPLLFCALYSGMPLKLAIWVYAVCELISALIRIPILKKYSTINTWEWVKEVFILPAVPIMLIGIIYYLLASYNFNFPVFICECFFVSILYLVVCYFIALNEMEKTKILWLLKKLTRQNK